MTRKTVVPGAASQIEKVVEQLRVKYKPRHFEIQVLEVRDEEHHGKLFQMKETSDKDWLATVKSATGLGTAASVKFICRGQDLEVEVFGGKWLDKAAAGAVSLVVLWPLLVTSGIGAWKQNALLDELYNDVALFLAGDRGSLVPPVAKPALAPPTRSSCPSCGTSITAAMRFCGGCGIQL